MFKVVPRPRVAKSRSDTPWSIGVINISSCSSAVAGGTLVSNSVLDVEGDEETFRDVICE